MQNTINIEPTPDGYVNVARTLVEGVRGDIKKARTNDALYMFGGVVRLAVGFASKGDVERVEAILKMLEGDDFMPYPRKP